MTRRGFFTAAALVATTGAVGWIASAQQAPDAERLTFLGEPVTAAQLALGQEVYAATCASCHGADLEGQPDWRRRNENGRMPAPPHDASGHTWHHADRQLFTITRLGVSAIVPGYESDMPAFEGILSDDEIVAVLAYIKSTWPERERGFQAEVTVNDGGGS
jgi:mono/diheme cytochrome c family protein